jgi:hypothetical protein
MKTVFFPNPRELAKRGEGGMTVKIVGLTGDELWSKHFKDLDHVDIWDEINKDKDRVRLSHFRPWKKTYHKLVHGQECCAAGTDCATELNKWIARAKKYQETELLLTLVQIHDPDRTCDLATIMEKMTKDDFESVSEYNSILGAHHFYDRNKQLAILAIKRNAIKNLNMTGYDKFHPWVKGHWEVLCAAIEDGNIVSNLDDFRKLLQYNRWHEEREKLFLAAISQPKLVENMDAYNELTRLDAREHFDKSLYAKRAITDGRLVTSLESYKMFAKNVQDDKTVLYNAIARHIITEENVDQLDPSVQRVFAEIAMGTHRLGTVATMEQYRKLPEALQRQRDIAMLAVGGKKTMPGDPDPIVKTPQDYSEFYEHLPPSLQNDADFVRQSILKGVFLKSMNDYAQLSAKLKRDTRVAVAAIEKTGVVPDDDAYNKLKAHYFGSAEVAGCSHLRMHFLVSAPYHQRNLLSKTRQLTSKLGLVVPRQPARERAVMR